MNGINQVALLLVIFGSVSMVESEEKYPDIHEIRNGEVKSQPTFSYGSVSMVEAKEKCPEIHKISNGTVKGKPTFSLGALITFSCNTGYTMTGAETLRCEDDGRWKPDPPICEIVRCGNFGDVKHATISPISGNNVYGSKKLVTCNEGFVMQGSPDSQCKADGKWESKPNCTKSPCGSHPGLNSSCIYESNIAPNGRIVTLLCKASSSEVSVTEIGGGVMLCKNGVWNDLDTGCFCDCKISVDSKVKTLNLGSNNFLKHNKTLQWECENGYKKQSEAELRCYDGKIMMPKCVPLSTTVSTIDPVSTENSTDTASRNTKVKGEQGFIKPHTLTPVLLSIVGLVIVALVIAALLRYKQKCSSIKEPNKTSVPVKIDAEKGESNEKHELTPMVKCSKSYNY